MHLVASACTFFLCSSKTKVAPSPRASLCRGAFSRWYLFFLDKPSYLTLLFTGSLQIRRFMPTTAIVAGTPTSCNFHYFAFIDLFFVRVSAAPNFAHSDTPLRMLRYLRCSAVNTIPLYSLHHIENELIGRQQTERADKEGHWRAALSFKWFYSFDEAQRLLPSLVFGRYGLATWQL